jgi:prepilin-type N-terminal cleavage/methylation domain-containing protein
VSGTAWWVARSRARRASSDQGFTLVELSVTMLILAIVMGLCLTLFVGLQQSQVNERASIEGEEAAQLATQQLVQYMQASTSPIPGTNVPTGTTETSTQFVLPAYLGTTASGAPAVTTTITATVTPCTTQCAHNADELTVMFVGTTHSVTVSTYYLLAPASPVFVYEQYNTTTGGPALQPMTTPVTNPACMKRIVAVQLDASFLAGPGDTPTHAGGGEIATTLLTTIFIRNAPLVYGATTVPPSTTTTIPSC